MLAGAGTVFAQGTVRGTVTDQLGAVVKDAKVILRQGDKSTGDTISDAEGAFTFSSVPEGRYRLRVDASGFATYTGPEIFVRLSGTTTFDATLQLSAVSQGVSVSATGSQIPIAQVGSSVSVIDQQDIDAQNKLDLVENLRQVAGAQIVQTGQRGAETSLFIRGGDYDFNKIMIDGAPANSIGGAFDFAQLSNGGVESIEVLEGANSVLYGPDALAGVVNITTQHGTSSLPTLTYSVDGGNFGTLFNSVSLGGALHQFDYFVLFSRFDTQGSYSNDFFHNDTYVGNFGYKINSSTETRVIYRSNWTDAGNPNGILFYGISDAATERNQNQYLSGTLKNQTTKRWHNLVRFAFAQLNSTYIDPLQVGMIDANGDSLGNVVTIRGANGYSVSGQAILDFAGAYPEISPDYEARRSVYLQSDYNFYREWTFTAGFQYEHEDGEGFTRNNYNSFIELHGNLRHRLYVTAGGGLVDNAVFGFAAVPNVSVAYYLRKPSGNSFLAETKLRFNFGKGIKEPSTYEQANQLWALLTPGDRTQYGVSQVGPERSRVFDFGIQQGLWHGRSRLELTYFQNRFYDLLTYLNPAALVSVGVNPAAAAATEFGAYVNASSEKSKGAQVQFVTELGHGLRAQANYTYLDGVVTQTFGAPAYNPAFPGIPIGAFEPLLGARPFRRPPQSGSFALYYARRKFTAALTGYLAGRSDDTTALDDANYGNTMLLPNRNLNPGYQKIDLSGRYSVRPWVSVYTSMENILSEHYTPAFGFPALPFAIRAGLTFTIGGDNWRK
jgi:iron complex outermembrane receptor protein/vitamin B12 transporter